MGDLHDTIDRKFIESYDVSDYEILTDTGWEDISKVHKTVPYEVFELKTDGHSIKCADTHIVFDENMNEVFVESLDAGDIVKTDSGDEKVLSVKNLGFSDNMYDIELTDESHHRYYADGILSHNSTTYSIYFLWQAMFFPDKKIAIAADAAAKAKEILSRTKLAYEYLPKEIKPAVTIYNSDQLAFDNNSEIRAFATGGNTLAGFSCVTGDAFVTVIDDFGGIWYTSIDRVQDIANSSISVNNSDIEEFAMKKHNFVYKTTNLINMKEYIGVHSTDDLNDGYIGSGTILKKAIEKYGIDNFTKIIIKDFQTRDEALELEKELVNEEYVKRDDTYNVTVGGGDAPCLVGEENGFYGKHHDEETCSRMKIARKKYFETHKNPCIGMNVSTDDDVIVDGIRYNSIHDMSVKLKIWQTPKIMELLLQDGNGFVNDERQKQLRVDYDEYLKEKEERHQHHLLANKLSHNTPEYRKAVSERLSGKKHDWQDKINKNPEKIRKMAEKHRGMKRSESAKNNMKQARARFFETGGVVGNKGKIMITNMTTGKHKYIDKNQVVPDGWVRGGKCKS